MCYEEWTNPESKQSLYTSFFFWQKANYSMLVCIYRVHESDVANPPVILIRFNVDCFDVKSLLYIRHDDHHVYIVLMTFIAHACTFQLAYCMHCTEHVDRLDKTSLTNIHKTTRKLQRIVNQHTELLEDLR